MFFEILCAILLVTNLVTIAVVFRQTKPTPQLTTDANKLLSELLAGGAVAILKVVDPSAIFLWSPKDRGEP
jgi:hypothetical protein